MIMGTLAFRFLTLALAGVLPLTLSTAIEDVFFGAWRAAQWAFLGPALVLAGVLWLRGRAAVRLDNRTVAWSLFAAWVLAGAGRSVNPWDGLRRALELAGAVAAYGLGRAQAGRFRLVRTAAVGAAWICSLYALLQGVGIDPLPWSTRFGQRGFGTLGNPDYYAGHLLLVIPLLFAGRLPSLPVLAGVGGPLVVGFLLSQVRGAWLAAVAAAGWAVVWTWRAGGLQSDERKFLGRAVAGAAGLLVVALVFVPGLRERLFSIGSVGGYDATGRRYLWTVAAREFAERPLVGHGTGAFKFEFPRHQHVGQQLHLDQFRPYNYSEHAHSELLQLGAELGLIGIVLFLAGMGLWLRRWAGAVSAAAAQGDREHWRDQMALGVGLAGSFAYSWVNFPLQIVPTATLWFLLVGMGDGMRTGSADAGRSLPRALTMAAGVLLLVLGAVGSFVTASDLVGNAYLKHIRGQLEADSTPNARAFAEVARRAAPHDYRVWRWISRIAIKLGDQAMLEQSLAARAKLHPHLADALSDRADFFRHGGQVTTGPESARLRDEALARYQALLAVAPNFVSAWGEIGTIRFERGEYQLAVDAFQRAIYFQDANAVWHHNLASAFGIMKRYREALAADQAAVQRDPRFTEAYIGVALSAMKLHYRVLARQYAEQAYRLNPSDSRALTLLRQVQ